MAYTFLKLKEEEVETLKKKGRVVIVDDYVLEVPGVMMEQFSGLGWFASA